MGKPKPFSRPSINLGGGPKKDWQEVEVQFLSEGDVVQGRGTVVSVVSDGDTSSIIWKNGTQSLHPSNQKMTAFTAV